VAGEVQLAVIGPGPDLAAGMRRLGDPPDRAVVLNAGLVPGDVTAGGAKRLGFSVRQVGAAAGPALARVVRAPDMLRADVDDPRVVARRSDRVVPLEAFSQVHRGIAHRVYGPDIDGAVLAGDPVHEAHRAAGAGG